MQCAARLRRTGDRCPRPAVPGSAFCRRHGRQRSTAPDFYARLLTPEERADLAAAAQLDGIDAEIAILRVLIRRVASQGDLDAARKGIDTLTRALKVQYALSDRATDNLSQALVRVLDEIGRELGMAL
ncbi:MAG TPA: hypothetical protein VIN09_02075 [Chloroflexota bacterium]